MRIWKRRLPGWAKKREALTQAKQRNYAQGGELPQRSPKTPEEAFRHMKASDPQVQALFEAHGLTDEARRQWRDEHAALMAFWQPVPSSQEPQSPPQALLDNSYALPSPERLKRLRETLEALNQTPPAPDYGWKQPPPPPRVRLPEAKCNHGQRMGGPYCGEPARLVYWVKGDTASLTAEQAGPKCERHFDPRSWAGVDVITQGVAKPECKVKDCTETALWVLWGRYAPEEFKGCICGNHAAEALGGTFTASYRNSWAMEVL